MVNKFPEVETYDRGLVPENFPKLYARGRIYSEDGKLYMPYYKARDIWNWFKEQQQKRLNDYE